MIKRGYNDVVIASNQPHRSMLSGSPETIM